MRSLPSRLAALQARIVRFGSAAVERFETDALSLRAMGLTYTTLLSLVPLLAVTFSVLKAFGVQNQLEPALAQALEPLGPTGTEITQRIIQFVNNLQVGVLGAVGVAGLFYTVISLISKIEESLNAIWRVRRPRTLGQKFSDYLSVVLVGPVLIFTAFALIAAAQASAQGHWLVQRVLAIKSLGFVFIFTTQVMPFVVLCAVFTFLYKFLPHTQVRLRAALVGGVVAGILWQLAGTGFTTFVAGSTRYAAIYSSFAILILFLIWLYVGWLVVLVGGEVTYFCQYPNVYKQEVASGRYTPLFQERLALSALVAITQRYLADLGPWYPTELAARLGVPLSSLEEILERLVQQGILFRTAEPTRITLGRPPEHITGVEVLSLLRGTAEEPPHKGPDPVLEFLYCRDQAVQHALAEVTLRSLASDADSNMLQERAGIKEHIEEY